MRMAIQGAHQPFESRLGAGRIEGELHAYSVAAADSHHARQSLVFTAVDFKAKLDLAEAIHVDVGPGLQKATGKADVKDFTAEGKARKEYQGFCRTAAGITWTTTALRASNAKGSFRLIKDLRGNHGRLSTSKKEPAYHVNQSHVSANLNRSSWA
jgi:hypothetical protein